MTASSLLELMTREEPLLESLAPYVRECGPLGVPCLHHPLLIDVAIDPEQCGLVNERFRRAQERAVQAMSQERWHEYVFLHERPYRLQALARAAAMARRMVPVEYWRLVREVWIDTENAHEYPREWREIWSAGGSDRVMTRAERRTLGCLPVVVRVWRGGVGGGVSWTLSRETARWYARRWCRDGERRLLMCASVPREEIRAILLSRGEREVILPHAVEYESETVEINQDEHRRDA